VTLKSGKLYNISIYLSITVVNMTYGIEI